MKKILIISPHFPPVNSPDMQRVRMSLPFYKKFGWEPTVICVDENYVEGFRDELLSKTIPEVQVYKVKAFSIGYTRKFGLGSLSIRSFFQFRKIGNFLLKNEKFDLIFFSTTAFHVCRLGPYWKRKFKIPFIVDMQDPWRNDFYLDKPASERPPKFRVSYLIDKYLEGATIPYADGIMSVSEGYRLMLMKRYSGLKNEQFEIIPFAASLNDFTIAKQFVKEVSVKLKKEKFNIVYVGRGGHDLAYSLSILFTAIDEGLKRDNETFKNIHLTFVGTSYAHGNSGRQTIVPVAARFNLENIVTELPGRISYFETLSLLEKADMLFVPGSTDTAYTASKIYPYVILKKPLLAIFHYSSSVINFLENVLSVKNFIAFDNRNDYKNYADECIEKLHTQILSGFNDLNMDKLAPYLAEENTHKQAKFFNRVVNSR